MSWLEFAANFIDNVLSWPVAVFLIVVLLRKQLRELFRTIENFVLESGGTKVSFTRSLERAREGVAAATVLHEVGHNIGLPHSGTYVHGERTDVAARKEDEYLANQYKHTLERAESHPSYAIEVAWDRLIAEQVRRLAHDRDLPPADDTFYQLSELYSRGVVPDSIVRSAKNLNRIRFRVTTAEMDPSPNEALEYVEVAWAVAHYLSFLRSEDAKPQSPQ
jgi:hypothetical protein